MTEVPPCPKCGGRGYAEFGDGRMKPETAMSEPTRAALVAHHEVFALAREVYERVRPNEWRWEDRGPGERERCRLPLSDVVRAVLEIQAGHGAGEQRG